ncbi:hypothetical protein JTE90_014685 [Oedothorax gibbosus]|uniref:Uncharacterized protein n=1 Tax=Oedothorax gibbosus TaxID=931172 RepID=A0AAV6TUF1_9ARAC|nr:hypothetical protein JTE90_014685 [Oedothorax gibbosus]
MSVFGEWSIRGGQKPRLRYWVSLAGFVVKERFCAICQPFPVKYPFLNTFLWVLNGVLVTSYWSFRAGVFLLNGVVLALDAMSKSTKARSSCLKLSEDCVGSTV